jgi:hypothetical protein
MGVSLTESHFIKLDCSREKIFGEVAISGRDSKKFIAPKAVFHQTLKISKHTIEQANFEGTEFLGTVDIAGGRINDLMANESIFRQSLKIPTNSSEIVRFTIEQIARPLNVWNWRYDLAKVSVEACNSPNLWRLMATIQSLVPWIFITLGFLAVRRRFRYQ